MNNRMYTYTREKREYAYIYILAKNWTNWTHPPHKSSNGAGSQACPRVCPIIKRERGENMEKDIERWLGNQLKNLGCIYMKFVSPGNDGVPDRIVILPGGLVVFAELKDENGRLRPNQRVQIERMRKLGASVSVVTGKLGATLFVDDIRRAIYGLSSTRISKDSNSKNH